MTYSLIDTTKIFIYKALPEEMKDRVFKLPKHVETTLPIETGFSNIDQQIKASATQIINLTDFPERHLTQCSLMDNFAALVHQYGYKRVDFYAQKLGINRGVELSMTVKILTGFSIQDFITSYTLKMIRDLQYRTDLYNVEIGRLLHFPSPPSFSQFLKCHSDVMV